jgi:hypothetical protein
MLDPLSLQLRKAAMLIRGPARAGPISPNTKTMNRLSVSETVIESSDDL